MTYEESIKKLESIVLQMEQGEMPIDTLATHLAEANQLIADCRAKLLLADQQVQETLNQNETN